MSAAQWDWMGCFEIASEVVIFSKKQLDFLEIVLFVRLNAWKIIVLTS
jgi:hypothetical protein